MTPPRRLLEGQTHLLTRRCTQRQYLLQPDATTNAIVEYLLAHFATVHGLRIHAFCCLGNHYHAVATDPDAKMSRFIQDFNGLLARAVNAHRGRRENLWGPGEMSVIPLFGSETVLDKIVYTIANPVSSWLVEESKLWPGVRSQPEDIGTVRSVPRPEFFFRKDGDMPPVARLEITAPLDEHPDAYRAKVAERVKERETELRRQCWVEGRSFLGLRRLYLQRPEDSPTTRERWWKLMPRIACKDWRRRIEELGRLKEFLEQYRAALREYRAGARDVLFPAGTYHMRVFHGVNCATPSPGWLTTSFRRTTSKASQAF